MRVKHIKFYKDGEVLAVGYLLNGKPDGYWKWYRKDGSKMKLGFFKDGKLERKWMKYDKNGKLMKSI